jgi:hypothetical protein
LRPKAATDRAIAADRGDAREAVKAPIMTANFHETNSLKADGGSTGHANPFPFAYGKKFHSESEMICST